MEKNRERFGVGTRIVTGFLALFALMASLVVTGLHHLSTANDQLRDVVENNNVKTELASAMQATLRERALSMHALSVLTDSFEKDAELLHFDALGANYVSAREQFEKMPLSHEEKAILERIRSLTRSAQPEVQTVVSMAMEGRNEELFERIRNIAIPRQREIAEQLDQLTQLQKKQAAASVESAEASYRQIRSLFFLAGAAALLGGLLIALFVSRQAQLATMAMYDPLTGLPNRNLLQDRLKQAIAQSRRVSQSFAVALMDLNFFKEINDTLGHDAGDELLRRISSRLRDAVRGGDTVARMGGDEFVMILNDLAECDIPTVSAKLLAALDEPFVLEGQSIDVDASVGFSLYPSHADDPGSLIRLADIAMYTAKRTGKDHMVYAQDQQRNRPGDLSLKAELREAIQTNQLCIHYQPKFSHPDRRIIGFEALLRWNHPQRGLLQPDNFIPMAEEVGLIEPLSRWVLENALTRLSELHRMGYTMTMGINLSARCLHNQELPVMISELLTANGIAPEFLTLEITESAIMCNSADVMEILKALDRMGVALSIDDFGTGYSSLAHLKQLPVDEIKIDKSFVIDMENNENDAVIVHSTIGLAHNLGLKVTAEGVETEDAWNMLSVLGCDHSQGFFMSKPIPSEELVNWLKNTVFPGKHLHLV